MNLIFWFNRVVIPFIYYHFHPTEYLVRYTTFFIDFVMIQKHLRILLALDFPEF